METPVTVRRRGYGRSCPATWRSSFIDAYHELVVVVDTGTNLGRVGEDAHKFVPVFMQEDIEALERHIERTCHCGQRIHECELRDLYDTLKSLKTPSVGEKEKRRIFGYFNDIHAINVLTVRGYHDIGCGCVLCQQCKIILFEISLFVTILISKYKECVVQRQLGVLLMLDRIPVELVRVVREFLI